MGHSTHDLIVGPVKTMSTNIWCESLYDGTMYWKLFVVTVPNNPFNLLQYKHFVDLVTDPVSFVMSLQTVTLL